MIAAMSLITAVLLRLGLLASDACWAWRRRRTIRQAHHNHDAYRRAVRVAMAAEARGEAAEWPRHPGSWP